MPEITESNPEDVEVGVFESPPTVGADVEQVIVPAEAAPDTGASPPIERPEDPVGVVLPGDSDGLAALVVRSLGMGDSGVYDGPVVDHFKGMQERAGLEPDGIVSGASWALVLRDLKLGDIGWEVGVLRGLLGLGAGTFDADVEYLVGPVVTSADWVLILSDPPQWEDHVSDEDAEAASSAGDL